MAGPRELTLAELLAERAAETPEAGTFLVDGSAGLSYGEWDRRSNALARALRRRGVDHGDRVVLWFHMSTWADYAVAYAGVHKAGGIPVPVGSSMTGAEVARVVAHSGAAAIVAAGVQSGGRAPQPAAWISPPAELEDGEDDAELETQPGGPDVVEISYRCRPLERPLPTPRRAEVVLSALAALDVPARPPASMIHSFSVGTDAATEAMWFPLTQPRGPVVALPTFDPERFYALTAEHRVERWSLAPSTALWALRSGALDGRELSSVRQVVLQGGRTPPSLLSELAARLPDASLISVLTGADRATARVAFAYDERRPGSLGRPLGEGGVRLADAQQELADGEVGHVQVSDPGPGRRGHDRRWSPTGNLGYVDDGFLYVVASRNEVVRTGELTLSEADVVGVLRRHPAVSDAALVGLPDNGRAERVVAAVALRSPTEAGQLEELLRSNLGASRSPDSVVFVDQLPRNRAGGLLARRLRASLRLGADRPDHVAPGSDVERTTASIWERVLGVEGIGVEDDFFELGGDQLAGSKVLALLDEAVGVDVPLSTLLEAATVSALAAAVQQGPGPDDPSGDRVAPVAASQEGMVWHEVFAPGSQNLPPLVRRYRGPLDVDVFSRALAEIVRRHEPLRTTFELRGGRPVQVVSPPPGPSLTVRDLGRLGRDEQDEELASVLAAASRPFDLVDGPLFEPTLLRLGPDDHVAVFRVHHSVYDDWSVGVFRRELSALYAALAAGDDPPLAALPLSFPAFSRGQRRRLAGPVGAAQLSWWKRTLAGGPLALELAIDDPDRPEGSAQPSAEPVSVDLSPELSTHLRALARRERATPFMTVLAAFEVLVHRYTGQRELLLASVVANRNRTELEGMIGCFTKKILLRQELSGEATFAEVLARTRSVLLGALSNQDLPFETVLQEALGPAAAMHGLVPYPVVMVQGVTPQAGDVVLPGIATSGYDTSATTRRAHFSAGPDHDQTAPARPWGAGLYGGTFLILSVTEGGDHLSLSARGAFHRPAVVRLLGSFGALLADVVAHPYRPVSGLSLLAEGGQALPASSQHTGDEVPVDCCLHSLFEDQVARDPSAVAVSAGDRALTFAELDARADELADRLRSSGVGTGRLVGLCLPVSVECVVGALAIWKSGAGYVGLDGDDSDERLASVVEEASLDVVLTPPEVGRHVLAGRSLPVPVGDVHPPAAAPGADPGPGPEDPALVFYGAGASAVPRGVVLPQRSVASLLVGLRDLIYRRSSEGQAEPQRLRVGLSAAPTEDSFLRQLVALLDGHSLQVVDRGDDGGTAGLTAMLRRGAVDVVDCTADQFRVLAAGHLAAGHLAAGHLAEAAPGRRGAPPIVVVGSRAAGGGDAGETQGTAPVPGLSVQRLFGPPECGFAATQAGRRDTGGRVILGPPLTTVALAVVDAAGAPAPVGAAGELEVSGPGVAFGYLSEAGGPAPLRPDEELGAPRYRTGELARRRPDGRIELLGAASVAVDLRGFRLDPGRIEATLRRWPAVREAAVALRGTDGLDQQLVAYVVPADDEAPTLARLRVFLWRELPGYAWPADLVVVPELPAPSPLPPGPDAPDASDPASYPTQANALAALWADVLGVDRVPVDENYWQRFSFLEVVARAREAGVPLGDHHVTRNRTVAALAVDLAAEGGRVE